MRLGHQSFGLTTVNAATVTLTNTTGTIAFNGVLDFVGFNAILDATKYGVFLSMNGKVYALDGATGAKRWEFTTGDAVISSPSPGPSAYR